MTDAQWERLSPLLPPQKPGVGRPARDHRTILSAILWVLRTGAPWRDLPERFGPWATAWRRFRRWTAAGIWARALEVLQRNTDLAGQLDWDTHYVDGTVIRAHQHAAGAVGGQEHEALGRSRGGFSTKVHVRAEGSGKPMVVVLSGGERHESRYVRALLSAGRVRRRAQGRPRVRPRCLVGDRGYSYPTVRRLLARCHIRAVIPRRRDQRPGDGRYAPFDHHAYRKRNRVERLMNRLKQHRRVATRYEKRALHYLAMLTIAAVLLWL
ncbi:MAG: Mobile element protein [uncultured Gemmatimonadaceae bacterium]|uniref:Mobile element protein n=1 Tax=uncultured Gemmatimonadaceae bacterium TaxID=246130 RepID=A0A6J4MD43_9BACT|nr:MAG: Mobile element protein [uncultured Gemmatimonadaceae bacterium]